MIPDFGKADYALRLIVPHLLLAAFFFINHIPVPVPGAGDVKPQLMLMAVYYWAIYRPTIVPPVLCFCAGLMMDIMSGGAMGVNALILLAVQWVVRDQRRFLMGQPYVTIWAVFGVVALLASAIQWMLLGLGGSTFEEILPLLAGAGVSLFMFPLVSLLLFAVHKLLPVASRGYS